MNNKAFTLLEAMVVIVIIGILAAVAVPNILNAIKIQRHIASGLVVQSALNEASSIVKKTRQDASVLITGNRVTVYQGCDSCVTNCTVATLTPKTTSVDSFQTKISLAPLPSTISTAPITGFSPSTSSAFRANSGWFSKSNGVCVNFGWGRVGNTVDSTGWLSLRDTTQTKFGVMVLKSATDNRFQVWFYNGSWQRKSP